ncbi:MAG: hypothetical protein AAF329_26125 [Cyanobacteria bacterium P01_A01_bin.17]
MLKIQYFAPSPPPEAAPPGLSGNSVLPRRRRRVRLYLVGAPEDTQHIIDGLHVRGCIERIEWSHAIAVPESGIIIRQDPGDVLRYLQREGPRSLL